MLRSTWRTRRTEGRVRRAAQAQLDGLRPRAGSVVADRHRAAFRGRAGPDGQRAACRRIRTSRRGSAVAGGVLDRDGIPGWSRQQHRDQPAAGTLGRAEAAALPGEARRRVVVGDGAGGAGGGAEQSGAGVRECDCV